MPVLVVLLVIIILSLSTKNDKKKSKFVKILALPSGELIKIKKVTFTRLRQQNKLKWNSSHKYWSIRDKNRKAIKTLPVQRNMFRK